MYSTFRALIDISIFFTNKELYSIAERYKQFKSTKIKLIHNNKILKKNESSINEISNGDIIWVIENKLYPDNSFYISLQNKYNDYNGTDIINVRVDFTDGSGSFIYSLSGEITVQELIRAIIEHKGYVLNDCEFLYNASRFHPDDLKKIKEYTGSVSMRITCNLFHTTTTRSPFLGKIIVGHGNETSVQIGTLEPISNLFVQMGRGKIIIGNVELKRESDNYLSFYGINDDFDFIWKEE